jgi:hypothetical protein
LSRYLPVALRHITLADLIHLHYGHTLIEADKPKGSQ